MTTTPSTTPLDFDFDFDFAGLCERAGVPTSHVVAIEDAGIATRQEAERLAREGELLAEHRQRCGGGFDVLVADLATRAEATDEATPATASEPALRAVDYASILDAMYPPAA